MMKKTYIVTGGAGFIGSHIARALLDAGHHVRIIDNFLTGSRERVPKDAELFAIDIRDTEKVKDACLGASGVFHAAADPRLQWSIRDPKETHDNNSTGTLSVLVAAKDAGVRRVVYSASAAAYGSPERMPLTEDMRPDTLSPYAAQKLMGESYMRVFAEIYGIETVSLRYFNVYGPGQDPNGPYAAVISAFLRMRREGAPLTIVGDGSQKRDFVHVSDVVAANLSAMESPKAGKGEIINIGSGTSTSVCELAEIFDGPVVHIPPRAGDVPDSCADIAKAKHMLGWEPRIPLREGIAALMRETGIQAK